ETQSGKPAGKSRFRFGRRMLAGDKDPPAAWQPDAERATPAESEPQAPELDEADAHPAPEGEPEAGGSFLARYRVVFLAVMTLVALALLVNLMIPRLTGEQSPAVSAEAEPVNIGDAALSPTPLARQLVLPEMPAATNARVISMTDSLQTASVDPAAAQGFSPVDAQPMPPAVAAAADIARGDTDR